MPLNHALTTSLPRAQIFSSRWTSLQGRVNLQCCYDNQCALQAHEGAVWGGCVCRHAVLNGCGACAWQWLCDIRC
jgi:hypothetical protein